MVARALPVSRFSDVDVTAWLAAAFNQPVDGLPVLAASWASKARL
jgi:hypothetical protein